MTLVAHEDIGKPIVDALPADGRTVKNFAEAGSGSSDKDVLAVANDAQNLWLTCDKDFGELMYRHQPANCGVVLIRLDGVLHILGTAQHRHWCEVAI